MPDDDWVESISDPDLRERIQSRGFKTPEDVAKSYFELDRHLSTTSRVPSKDASDEEWSKYFRAIGRPETPDGYDTEPKENHLKKYVDALKKPAHEAGLSKKQFDAFVTHADEVVGKHRVDFKEALKSKGEEWRKELEEKYGSALEEKRALAERFQKAITKDSPDLRDAFKQMGIEHHPQIFDFLSKGGELMQDDRLGRGLEQEDGASFSIKEAKELAMQCREIVKKPEFMDKKAADHEKLKARYLENIRRLMEEGYNGPLDERLKVDPLSES